MLGQHTFKAIDFSEVVDLLIIQAAWSIGEGELQTGGGGCVCVHIWTCDL